MNVLDKLHKVVENDDNIIDILDVELDVTDEEEILIIFFLKFDTETAKQSIGNLMANIDKIDGISSSLVEGQLEDAIAENDDTVEIDLNCKIEEEFYGIC